jgi:hypothetical protein
VIPPPTRSRPHADARYERRLREAPRAELSAAELEAAHRRGYVSAPLFNAEQFRRERERRVYGEGLAEVRG